MWSLNLMVTLQLFLYYKLCSDDRLRSALRQDYDVPRTYTRLADSSFCVAWPTAWNSLPVEFRCTSTYSSFCSRLKTFLFSKFYSQWHCTLFTVFFVSLFYCQAPLNVGWGRHSKWLIDWLKCTDREYAAGTHCRVSEVLQETLECAESAQRSTKLRRCGNDYW